MANVVKEVVRYGCGSVVLTIILLLLAYLSFPVFGYSEKNRCVHLKNGISIGYNAVFDLSRPYWRPYVVPKLPDGTPLVKADVWPIYITDTTLYGTAIGETGDKDYRFAWRTDLGLVHEKGDRQTYELLVSEAGPANVGLGTGAYGTTIVMRWLMELPEYSDQWCSTKLFAW
ncbi:hypothetical protein GGD81_003143 [Rhodobium orientis]|uniref:hypothetical protein n=1 Tax=Rhodobium orientis TaxID=34017 RepID=UPI0011B93E09|nr:hypothetical protein [Rhodobium orientis]MBB4304088.1 hypothetical protein [Rhodobium orientis]